MVCSSILSILIEILFANLTAVWAPMMDPVARNMAILILKLPAATYEKMEPEQLTKVWKRVKAIAFK